MQKFFVPGSIVIAGAFIATGLYLAPGASTPETGVSRGSDALVRGEERAPTRIVEFSDLECPFCARLHPTLTRIVDESDGKIAWEYRHLPLSSHPNAKPAAIAGECIADMRGADAFFEYVEAAFKNQRELGVSFYESEAVRLGADIDDFRSCLTDETILDIVERDYAAGVSLGANGTPFVVVLFEDGTMKTFSGALPYEQISTLISGGT